MTTFLKNIQSEISEAEKVEGNIGGIGEEFQQALDNVKINAKALERMPPAAQGANLPSFLKTLDDLKQAAGKQLEDYQKNHTEMHKDLQVNMNQRAKYEEEIKIINLTMPVRQKHIDNAQVKIGELAAKKKQFPKMDIPEHIEGREAIDKEISRETDRIASLEGKQEDGRNRLEELGELIQKRIKGNTKMEGELQEAAKPVKFFENFIKVCEKSIEKVNEHIELGVPESGKRTVVAKDMAAKDNLPNVQGASAGAAVVNSPDTEERSSIRVGRR